MKANRKTYGLKIRHATEENTVAVKIEHVVKDRYLMTHRETDITTEECQAELPGLVAIMFIVQ